MSFESFHYVGRKTELELWSEFVSSPHGLVGLIVGNEGMGKSAFVDQCVLHLWHEKDLRCGYVRYDIGAEETAESAMRFILEDAFQSARASAGALDSPGLRFWQWDAFFEGVGIYRRRMDDIHRLVNALRFDPQKNISEQLLGRFQTISSLMRPEGRAIFFIDISGKTNSNFVEPWKSVLRELPSKIKVVFTQNVQDAFLTDPEFRAFSHLKMIPDLNVQPEGLQPLTKDEFDLLVSQYQFADNQGDIQDIFKRYQGNPYMVRAALDLLQTNSNLTVDLLPQKMKPHQIAQRQWEQVISYGPEAIRLFRAYAFLEVTVPDEIVLQVASLDFKSFKKTLDIPYIRSLIRSRSEGHQIVDRPLLKCIAEDERTDPPFYPAENYHRLAIRAMSAVLQRSVKPDAFSACRIPEHALALGGPYAFARSVSEVVEPLLSICYFDTTLRLIDRALAGIDPCGKEAGQLQYNTGQIWLARGNTAKAEEMFNEAMQILKNTDDTEVIPDVYLALGQIAVKNQQWDKAELYLRESYKGCEIIDVPEGMVDAATLLGRVLAKQGKIQEGEDVLKKALQTSQRIDLNRQMLRSQASIHCVLGSLFDEKGDLDSATNHFFRALDLTHNIYDRESEANIYANLRLLLEATGGLQKAEDYELKALAIYKELHNIEAMAICNTNLAYLAEKMGDQEKAKKRLNTARELYVQFGNYEKVKEIDTNLKRFKT